MSLYKVIYYAEEKKHEVYAKSVSQPDLYGFITVESFVFNQNSTNLLIDPAEEKLKNEFNEVKRSFFPVSSIIRIDEVTKLGKAKIKEILSQETNVATFPLGDKKKY